MNYFTITYNNLKMLSNILNTLLKEISSKIGLNTLTKIVLNKTIKKQLFCRNIE